MSSPSTLFDLRHLLRHIGALLSFEAVFLLFLITVNYKSDPRLSWLPVDSTIIFFVLGVAMGLVIVFREGIYLPGLVVVSLLFVFIAWVLLTTLWTPSETYALEKLLKLATLNAWSVSATAMIIANRRERVRRFLLLALVLGTAASIDGILRYGGITQYGTGAEAISANEAFSANFHVANYLGQGRFYGVGALVAFAAWLQTSPYSRRGVALMGAFAVCFYGLLITGGRGPMLATLAGMFLPLMLGLRFVDRRLFASKALLASLAMLAILVGVILYGAAEYSGSLRTLQRLNILLTEEAGGQTERLGFWTGSWRLWLEQPLFGSGVGSWPIRYFGFDIDRHPHNLIFEVLVEFGLVGLLLLVVVGVAAARRTSFQRLREDPLLLCAAMLCINTFFYAMESSDITENRNLFAMFGLLVMRPYGRIAKSRARDLAFDRRSELPQQMAYPGRSRA